MEFISTQKVVNAYYGMAAALKSTERRTMAEFIGDAPSIHALQEHNSGRGTPLTDQWSQSCSG